MATADTLRYMRTPTTSTNCRPIQENFEMSLLPGKAMWEIREAITATRRFNTVARTGVPAPIPRVATQ